MTIIDVKYDELDKALDELADSDDLDRFEDEGAVIEDDHLGNDIVVVQGPAWRVVDKGVIVAEGVYCNYLEEMKAYDPDWSLTLVYNDVPDEEFDPARWVYFEQDPPTTAIHNYLYAKEYTGFVSG